MTWLPANVGSNAVTVAATTDAENVMVMGCEAPVPGWLWKSPNGLPGAKGAIVH
jgi:hypothetical protein